jgi:predicted nucleic acid-binding protein
VSDAEVLQEILRRYVAINRRDAIQPAFDALLAIVDDVFPILPADVERAKRLLLTSDRFSARDALHVVVMQAHEVGAMMTFDRAFDAVPGLHRLSR